MQGRHYTSFDMTGSTNQKSPTLPVQKPIVAQVKYRTDAFEAIHSAASGLSMIGAIDKQTLRGFDARCLLPD